MNLLGGGSFVRPSLVYWLQMYRRLGLAPCASGHAVWWYDAVGLQEVGQACGAKRLAGENVTCQYSVSLVD